MQLKIGWRRQSIAASSDACRARLGPAGLRGGKSYGGNLSSPVESDRRSLSRGKACFATIQFFCGC
jgi:hypothetical protein